MAGSAAAAAATLGGAYLQSQAAGDAAPEFNPFNITLPGFGYAGINPQTNQIAFDMDPRQREIMSRSINEAGRVSRDPRFARVYNPALSFTGLNALPVFRDALDSEGIQNAMRGFNLRSQGANRMARMNLNRAASVGRAQQGALQQLGRNDMRRQNRLFMQGQQTINQADYGNIARQELDLLRTQAQPFEERAQNRLNQTLFGQGRLGTTGGALQTEAFARGLGQADLDRQLQALGRADTLRQQDRSLGMGLLTQAGNLGSSAASNFLSSAGIARNRVSDIDRGLGTLQGLNLDTFRGQVSGTEFENSRARQRMQTLQNIFGFGVDARNARDQMIVGAMTPSTHVQNQLMRMAQLGGNIGGQQAQLEMAAAPYNLQGDTGHMLGQALAGLAPSIPDWFSNEE